MNSKSRIDDLAERIYHSRKLYYNEQPILSDAAFDLLIDELKDLCPLHPAITSIGAPVADTSEWKKAEHKLIVMGSLDKASNEAEIITWVNKSCKPNSSIFFSEKLDGISINVVYENGKFMQAISRGNAKIGEDIGRNVIKMRGVKQTLSVDFTGSLRGEILLTNENHKKYFPELANPRNGASGITKRYDGENCDKLDVYFYQTVGNVEHHSEYLQLQYIEKTLRLQVPNYDAFVGATLKDISNYIIETRKKYMDGLRDKQPYMTDGLVFRINNLEDQNALGMSNGLRPRGAIAVKFEAESAIAILKEVVWQTGNSGRVVPVAILEPVDIGGVSVERAALHNIKRVKELDLYIGCKVAVSRRGDVIPFIECKIS